MKGVIRADDAASVLKKNQGCEWSQSLVRKGELRGRHPAWGFNLRNVLMGIRLE